MAELIVAGLAVVSTPPVLFAFEQLHLTLSGKKEEQKPRLGETEDVLPNLLKPKNVVKCNAVEKEDQKPHQGEAKDVFPNLLKTENLMQGSAPKKEKQKPKLVETKVVRPNCPTPKNVTKGNTTNKDSASQLVSPKDNYGSKTTAKTKPELPFSIVEHAASNPYLLKIPNSHRV